MNNNTSHDLAMMMEKVRHHERMMDLTFQAGDHLTSQMHFYGAQAILAQITETEYQQLT